MPWDGGTTNRAGARHGPREIRNASSLIRTYHPVSLKSPYDKYNVADIGDCPVNPANLEDSLDKIKNFYSNILSSKTIPLSIGGDHLVSLPILRALAKDKPLALFQFDLTQILGIHILEDINTLMEHLSEELLKKTL